MGMRARRSVKPGNVEVDAALWLGVPQVGPNDEEIGDDYLPLNAMSAYLTSISGASEGGERYVSDAEVAGRVIAVVTWMRRRTDDPVMFSFTYDQIFAEYLDGDLSTYLPGFSETLEAMVQSGILQRASGGDDLYKVGPDFDTYFRWTFVEKPAEA